MDSTSLQTLIAEKEALEARLSALNIEVRGTRAELFHLNKYLRSKGSTSEEVRKTTSIEEVKAAIDAVTTTSEGALEGAALRDAVKMRLKADGRSLTGWHRRYDKALALAIASPDSSDPDNSGPNGRHRLA